MASGVKSVALTAQAALVDFGAPVEDALEPDDDADPDVDAFAAPSTPPPTCGGTSDFVTPAAAALYAARVLGLPDLLNRLDQHFETLLGNRDSSDLRRIDHHGHAIFAVFVLGAIEPDGLGG